MTILKVMYRLWRVWLFLRYVDKNSIKFKAIQRRIKFESMKENRYQKAVEMTLNKEAFIRKYPELSWIPRVTEEGVEKIIERAERYGYLKPDPVDLHITDKGEIFIGSWWGLLQAFCDRYPLFTRVVLDTTILTAVIAVLWPLCKAAAKYFSGVE